MLGIESRTPTIEPTNIQEFLELANDDLLVRRSQSQELGEHIKTIDSAEDESDSSPEAIFSRLTADFSKQVGYEITLAYHKNQRTLRTEESIN